MRMEANSVEEYISSLPGDSRKAFSKLREVILENLPGDFREEMNYGMPGYVVPHSVYPPGYHCDPKQPLPFMSIASQKNYITFYHMGLYADSLLKEWFFREYPKHTQTKPDMGKSCIRFRKAGEIPYKLIGQLVKKLQAADWISLYETSLKAPNR